MNGMRILKRKIQDYGITLFYDNGMSMPSEIDKDLESNMGLLEKSSGKKFGDPKSPSYLGISYSRMKWLRKVCQVNSAIVR